MSELEKTNSMEFETRNTKKQNNRKGQQKKTKQIIIGIFAVAFCLIAGGGGYIWTVYQNYQKTQTKVQGKDLPDAKQVLSIHDSPMNILFIGIGTNGHDGQNTLADSINLLTINPQKNYAEMIALPRDSFVPFGDQCEWGAGYYDKITHATGRDAGGAKCLQTTLEDLFDVEINYYISLDFNGFVNIVDALGGVEMDIPDLRSGFEVYPGDPSDGMYLPPALKDGTQWCEHDSQRNAFAICFNEFGVHQVNGEQALALARSRHYDSDLGRSLRQTELIKAIAKKANGASGLLSANALLDAVGDSVETNIPVEQFTKFIGLASRLFDEEAPEPFLIRTTQLAGRGTSMPGDRITSTAYFSLVPTQSVEEIRQKLANALSEDERPILSADGMSFSVENGGVTYNDYLGKGMDVTNPDVVRKFR